MIISYFYSLFQISRNLFQVPKLKLFEITQPSVITNRTACLLKIVTSITNYSTKLLRISTTLKKQSATERRLSDLITCL